MVEHTQHSRFRAVDKRSTATTSMPGTVQSGNSNKSYPFNYSIQQEIPGYSTHGEYERPMRFGQTKNTQLKEQTFASFKSTKYDPNSAL